MPAACNFWPGQASREERREARRNIILEDVGATEKTQERYYVAVSRLRPLLKRVLSEADLDDLLADWIQSEFADGTPLHLVADALSGLHHFEPYTRKKLHKSWRLYSIWRKFEIPCRAPPLTQDIALAISGWCLKHGHHVMAALVLLGFHCLLRTGEILQIRPCDFLLNETEGLVSLPSSKSGVRNNSKESVTIHDVFTLELARSMIELLASQGLSQTPCWNFSGTCFRKLFSKALTELDLESLNFRPYSLRRGGPTYEFQAHGLMEKVLLRGRWKNSNIARLYICDGLSMLPRLKISWKGKQQVSYFSSVFTPEHKNFSRGKRGTAAKRDRSL